MNRPFDAIRAIGFAAPAPLLVQFARHESSFTEADMRRYYEAASSPKGPTLGLKPLRPLFEKRMEALRR